MQKQPNLVFQRYVGQQSNKHGPSLHQIVYLETGQFFKQYLLASGSLQSLKQRAGYNSQSEPSSKTHIAPVLSAGKLALITLDWLKTMQAMMKRARPKMKPIMQQQMSVFLRSSSRDSKGSTLHRQVSKRLQSFLIHIYLLQYNLSQLYSFNLYIQTYNIQNKIMIKQCALSLGKYLHEHWCQYCILRLLIVLTSLAALIFQIIYTIFYFSKHNDYHIHQGHYLLRGQGSTFNSFHIDDCCQYFHTLTQDDVDTINGHDKFAIVVTFICSFFGATMFSIWAIFLTMKGRFGSYATVTISSILLSQFSLMRAVIKYGEYCVQCSHLQILVVRPQFYPYFGLIIFVGGCILLGVYFKVDLEQNKIFYYLWLVLLIFITAVWCQCMIVTIINSPLGSIILIGVILDVFCLSQAYYEYDLKRNTFDQDEGCCAKIKSLGEFRSPF